MSEPPRRPSFSFSSFTPSEDLESTYVASVMVSHHPADKDFAMRLKQALQKEGTRPVVTEKELSENEDQYCAWKQHAGIEDTDCFICVLSPDAVENSACLWDIEYALKLGKRIVPVVAREFDDEKLHEALASMELVYFADIDFDTAMRVLLKAVDTDAAHAATHTKVLNAAIPWDKFDHDRQLLLKGDDIKEAQNWLCASAYGVTPAPSKLQLDFVLESSRDSVVPCTYHENLFYLWELQLDKQKSQTAPRIQAPTEDEKRAGCSVHITFSGTDMGITRFIHEGLGQDRKISVDWEDFPPSEEWLEIVHRDIERSDVLVYVLSPESIKSEKCNWELDHAVATGKRIVVAVCKDFDLRELRLELSKVAHVFFRPQDDFDIAMGLLREIVDADHEHVHTHTQLLLAGIEWTKNDFDNGKLLMGRDLHAAYEFIKECSLGRMPRPREIHLDYITASILYSRRTEAKKCMDQSQKTVERMAKKEAKERQRSATILKKAENKAVKFYKKGCDALNERDYFQAAAAFARAVEYDSQNLVYRKALDNAMQNKPNSLFRATVRGLSIPTFHLGESASSSRRDRKAMVEFGRVFIKLQIRVSQGILQKRANLEKYFVYHPNIQTGKDTLMKDLYVDITAPAEDQSPNKDPKVLLVIHCPEGVDIDTFAMEMERILIDRVRGVQKNAFQKPSPTAAAAAAAAAAASVSKAAGEQNEGGHGTDEEKERTAAI